MRSYTTDTKFQLKHTFPSSTLASYIEADEQRWELAGMHALYELRKGAPEHTSEFVKFQNFLGRAHLTQLT